MPRALRVPALLPALALILALLGPARLAAQPPSAEPPPSSPLAVPALPSPLPQAPSPGGAGASGSAPAPALAAAASAPADADPPAASARGSTPASASPAVPVVRRSSPPPVLSLRAAEALTLQLPPDQAAAALQAPPPEAADYAAVALPDDWAQSRPGHSGPVWYRLDLPPIVSHGQELPVLFIPRVCSSHALWLNGSLLHRPGRVVEPYSRHCYRSQLITLPPGLLRAEGANRLDLLVVGHALDTVTARQRAAGLSEIYLGPQSLLAGPHERLIFWNSTAAQAIALTLLSLGLFTLGLGWVQRVATLQYLGVLCFGAAAMSARLWWTDVPLPSAWVEVLSACAFVPLGICAVQFLLRYAGLGPSRRDVLLWAQCLLLPLAFALLGPERRFEVASAAYTLLAAQVLGACFIYLRSIWGLRPREFWAMLFVLGALGLVMLVEVAVQDRLLGLPAVQLMHFVMPAVFCAVALRLVSVYTRAMQRVEEMRRMVDQRVRDALAEAERNYSAMADQRAEQMAQKERKRIAGDLHDDLGAKLLTIVHTSPDERISNLAREALEEMRLSVRGLAGKPVELGDALADWRAECVSRLGEANIQIEWQSEEPDPPRTLSSRTYVQTTRILRESVSNMIKHSEASLCRVRCSLDADLHIVIHDNGKGIPMALDGQLDRGHGMASMKNRAKQMKGQCLVESAPGYGTVIRLTIPL